MAALSFAKRIQQRRYLCDEPTCAITFTLDHSTRRFCSTACRRRYHNREMLRGLDAIDIIREWRDGKRPNEDRQKAAIKRGNPIPTPIKPLGRLGRLRERWRAEDEMMRAIALRDAARATE